MHGFFGGGGPGAGFGVRRPLRFLGHRLGLSDEQIAGFARILDDLKTERAQAAVDERRSSASFADLLAAESFDDEAAKAIVEERVASAQRLAEAVVKALREVHGALEQAQRSKLATLIRGGVISL
ncbi:MAG: periplasmic heavy metal sensor [Nannocystaceae bacterium]